MGSLFRKLYTPELLPFKLLREIRLQVVTAFGNTVPQSTLRKKMEVS